MVNRFLCSEKNHALKGLTVLPGRRAVISDAAAYGFILLEGLERFGKWEMETPVIFSCHRTIWRISDD